MIRLLIVTGCGISLLSAATAIVVASLDRSRELAAATRCAGYGVASRSAGQGGGAEGGTGGAGRCRVSISRCCGYLRRERGDVGPIRDLEQCVRMVNQRNGNVLLYQV